jgi:AcrR family transcriptional regulator
MYTREKSSVKKRMADAFVDMLSQKSYADITVTDIVNTAQVARASFYRNFNSISDVVDYITDELANEFIDKIFPVLNSNDENKWREFLFDFINNALNNRGKIEAINLQNTAVLFSHLNTKMQMYVNVNSNKTISDKYTSYVKACLINNVVKKWIDDGMVETPEEIINYLMSFITLF